MILEKIKNFIFPRRCVLCDKILPYGSKLENMHLCEDCKENFEFIKEPTCKKCGAMISDSEESYCIRCNTKMPKYFDSGFGLLRYNDAVKESIHKIKYVGRKEYIDFYGKCIARTFRDRIREINPDYMIPVPIHKKRLLERNYNQSTILARAISKELLNYGVDILVNEDLISRIKNTRVLNKLDDSDRGLELIDAFSTYDLYGIEKVLIVDDIYTTGTTIDTMAKILKKAGVKEVYFVVIAVVDNL